MPSTRSTPARSFFTHPLRLAHTTAEPSAAATAGLGEQLRSDVIPRVVLSWGLGVDSTAILLRWLTDPTSRDFSLTDLVVITAMTGDEWPSTGRDAETYVLPLLRQHKVRFVQVARSQLLTTKAGAGIVVLDDSRQPDVVHLTGAYRLSDELTAAGTIPQSGGDRRCSLRAKGAVLDPVIATLTAGQPYRHVIGFEADELTRAYGSERRAGDASHDSATRTGEYPLIEWGWTRRDCLNFLADVTEGAVYNKSACTYCPFALANREGRTRVLQRIADDPNCATEALMMEHRALALNPAQGLIGGARLVDLLHAQQMHAALHAFTTARSTSEHALIEVRRILRPRRNDTTKAGPASRSLRTLARGSEPAMLRRLHRQARELNVQLDRSDTITRVWLRRRGTELPTSEHFLVVAPSGALDKQDKHFEQWWETTI